MAESIWREGDFWEFNLTRPVLFIRPLIIGVICSVLFLIILYFTVFKTIWLLVLAGLFLALGIIIIAFYVPYIKNKYPRQFIPVEKTKKNAIINLIGSVIVLILFLAYVLITSPKILNKSSPLLSNTTALIAIVAIVLLAIGWTIMPIIRGFQNTNNKSSN